MESGGTAAGTTAAGNLSNFGGCERWLGWRRSDGLTCRSLRNYQRPWNLVHDQSSVGWILPRQNDHRANCGVSLGRIDRGDNHPPDLFFTRWPSVWSGTPHVSSAADSVRGV